MISVLGTQPSFGFGDRLGLATPGHCRALMQFGGPIKGIFAQQSIREMSRTKRTPEQVVAESEEALLRMGYNEVRGADADHLKSTDDVDYVFSSGFTFFTIDPSAYVNGAADSLSEEKVIENFDLLEKKPEWIGHYSGQSISLDTGDQLLMDELAVKRCALKYGNAIEHAIELGRYIRNKADAAGREIEIEMSIDETDQPTNAVEHFVFADQLIRAGLPLVSLAPRFFGNFEKGIDFFGDRDGFEQTLREHAAIARYLNHYKLSLHSGSDKLSIYDVFARETRGRFHVKTAGTSYLEALHVMAATDEPFFRQVIDFSRERFEQDRATYHLSNGLADALDPNEIDTPDELLNEYLKKDAGRQILHVTFGSIMNHPDLGLGLRFRLVNHSRLYEEYLIEHFRKHLEPLTAGLNSIS